jgi:hypothetical protein
MPIAAATVPAQLECKDPAGIVAFHYNPKTLTLTKRTTWTPASSITPDPTSATRQVFKDMPPMTLSLEIFLDKWKTGGQTPAKTIAKLIEWANPTAKSPQGNPQPALVHFNWGVQGIIADIEWYFNQLSVKLMMFSASGEVTRATVSTTLQEFIKPRPKGNPTSGGIAGRRAHRVRLGDSLQSIAHAEYGRPGLWRALARANGIDDPLRVSAGTTILIPPRAEAENLV